MSKSPHAVLRSLIEDFSTAMLVTRADDGGLRGRPMMVADVEEDSDVWFVTSLDSEKVSEIEADPKVCVTMQAFQKFVSLTGTASVVKDAAKLKRLWQEPWKVWFPEGAEDPGIALLHVDATEGEFWDNSGIKGLKYLFRAGTAYLSGEQVQFEEGSHQKVDLSDDPN